MKRKILNILVIFFIVFISTFVNKKVEAELPHIVGETPDYKCEYISPISNINEKKIPTSIVPKIKFIFYDRYRVLLGKNENDERSFETSSISNFCLVPVVTSTGKKMYNLGFTLSEPFTFDNGKKGTKINQQVFIIGKGGEISFNDDYVEIKNKKGNVNFSISKSSEENYKNKLKKQSLNYSNYKGTELSKIIYLKFPTTTYNITGNDKIQNGVGSLDYSGSNILDYINKSDGIVFYKNPEKYKTARLNAFKDAVKTAKDSNGKVLDSESQQECIDGLSRIMDVSNTDMINYKKSYYDGSKDLWLPFLQDELANPKDASLTSYKNTWFRKWFDKSIARYLFEDDLSTFLSVYKYLYGVCDGSGSNQCNIDMNNDGVVGTANDVKVYKNTVTIMESMLHLDKTTKCSLDLSNDPCISVCAKSGECPNYTALDQCKNNSEEYNTCTNCTPECNKRCEGVGDETSKQQCKRVCYDECTDGRYSEAKDKYDETIQKDKDQIADSAKQIYDLVRVSAPSLDINFDKHYELTCDDVSFFHWFYVVLRILAPVAVIFFGTLDYAKAVIASDVEKMNKSKKNFPKRLILLILFITVPLIISLLLSIFGGDYSLMDCIINGE